MLTKIDEPVQLDLLEPLARRAGRVRLLPGVALAGRGGELIARFAALPFREFEFHGYLGKRRTVSFGLHYDFSDMKMRETEPIPEFLLPLRDRAAGFAGLDAEALRHALVTEYAPGARDRLAPRPAGIRRRDRRLIRLGLPLPVPAEARQRLGAGRRDAGAALGLSAARPGARREWEHSIPPAESCAIR